MQPSGFQARFSWGSPLLTLLLLALLAALLLRVTHRGAATGASRLAAPREAPAAVPQANRAGPDKLCTEENNQIGIYRRVSPSVVSVANKALVRAGFFGFQVYEVPQGAGSGLVWDREGHIISNYHVIHEADALTVTLPDGKSFDARVVGVAPDYDLAVLQIDAPGALLQPILPGTSRNLQVGQNVLAIGNPFGLDTSLSKGIISALGRSISAMTGQKIHDVIQTDAAINPGNSGGPLLDSSGRLIGVSTAILSPSGAYAGVGFAVPVDTVSRVVPQLIEKGHVSRAGLGVQLLPDPVTQRVGVTGVGIFAAPPGSFAAAAGVEGITRTRSGDLVLGDVVTAIDGHPVTCIDDLRTRLEKYKPGETAEVRLERNGRKRAAGIRLTEEQ
ncbi:MAG: trypsin-like peptidase domain-containing protein [bacterium]